MLEEKKTLEINKIADNQNIEKMEKKIKKDEIPSLLTSVENEHENEHEKEDCQTSVYEKSNSNEINDTVKEEKDRAKVDEMKENSSAEEITDVTTVLTNNITVRVEKFENALQCENVDTIECDFQDVIIDKNSVEEKGKEVEKEKEMEIDHIVNNNNNHDNSNDNNDTNDTNDNDSHDTNKNDNNYNNDNNINNIIRDDNNNSDDNNNNNHSDNDHNEKKYKNEEKNRNDDNHENFKNQSENVYKNRNIEETAENKDDANMIKKVGN